MNELHGGSSLHSLRKGWAYFYLLVGFWMWFCAFASIAASLFLVLIFEWARKVLPAFRRMMAGGPRSYLRLTEQGLEYRCWPLYALHCRWEDVSQLKRSRWLGDCLFLRRAEFLGFLEFSTIIGPIQVSLSTVQGWPHGVLEADLRRYVSRLF